VWRPERRHYVAAAARVLGVSKQQVERFPNLALAESALAAPFAGFGDHDAYPTFELKAAVLLEHLARNHPLPDGNKRAAFVVTVLFCESNGRSWAAPDPQIDAVMVERVAAGEVDLVTLSEWIGQRTRGGS
jgi:death-on-curing protein